ncbi:MAG TPA: VCBS repeat-containing protein [bacterium]|nr:VCBS repeat-containing protein [bacterium]
MGKILCKWIPTVLIVVSTLACSSENVQKTHLSADMFRHSYITSDLPGDRGWGYGTPTLADFDKDGDPDYAFCVRNDSLYWFENQDAQTWARHTAGPMPLRTLGATVTDVDNDGWQDILIGGYWYRNSQNPQTTQFELYRFDDTIENEIHDIVAADIVGDNRLDIVLTGDHEGAFWYSIPENPRQDMNWPRTTITMAVLHDSVAIHAGFFPRGVDDLDKDGDADIVMPDRWLENREQGQQWTRHPIPFGKRGPWGLSSRSWITDLDADGDNDIVMVDCDQKASRGAWLENHGDQPATFTAHFLPMTAPGIRGSFHSLYVGDFDNDGDQDIFTCDQEDDSILPEGAPPRWYIWENISSAGHIQFREQVILDARLGGHDALVGDADGDGDLDIFSKIWNVWEDNGNQGREHGDFLENLIIQ